MFMNLHDSRMEHFVKYPKILLISTGNWPTNNSKWSGIYNMYKIWIVRIVVIFFFAFEFINLLQSTNSIDNFVRAGYFFIGVSTCVVKYFIFSSKQGMFIGILKDLENPLFEPRNSRQKKFVDSWLRTADFYCKIYFYGCFFTLTSFMITPFLDKNEVKKLPIDIWLPFDTASNVSYVVAYFLCCIFIFLSSAVSVSQDLLPNVFMNISCAQIEILKDNIEKSIQETCGSEISILKFHNQRSTHPKVELEYYKLLDRNENDIVKYKLIRCINQYDAIIRLIQDVQNFFNLALLIMFISSVLSLCMIGLQLLTVPFGTAEYTSAALYLFIILGQMFLYCWCGHHVLIQSTTIGDSCYNIEWYRCNSKVKKIIFILMERCKRPLKINAGGIFILSMVTFTRLIRTSYQYFTVLQRAYD